MEEPADRSEAARPADVREEIAREQAHVDRCYVQLDRARERAQRAVQRAMTAPVSTPQSRFEREAELDRSLRRLRTVATGERQLVFGRLDLEDSDDPVYVGRVGLSDEERHRILVDWRAPVGSVYYRATSANPRGVVRRRTLVTSGREVVELNDDLLIPDKARRFRVVVGEGALQRSLEEVRGPFMQDILATIQADQDEIIRASPKANVVLTGGPGTGKSVVALHRTAFLMFERAEELERRGVLFVGPTARFSRYISRVLPSLGETSVQIRSLFNLTDPVVATAREPLEVGTVKGRPEMAKLVRRLLIGSYPRVEEGLRLRTAPWQLELSRGTLERLRDEALTASNDGMNRARGRLLRVLARRIAREEPSRGDDRKAIAELATEVGEEPQIEELLEAVLPIRDALRAWSDIRSRPDRFRSEAARWFSDAEARLLAEDLESEDIRVGDLPLIDEVRSLLGEPPPRAAPSDDDLEDAAFGELFSFQDRLDESRQQGLAAARGGGFGHVVVDEAQDLTPMQWRTLARLGRYATWNVVGDPNQATLATPEQMEASLARLPGAAPTRFRLSINYRTPAEIVEYAEGLSGLDLGGLTSIRRSGRDPAEVPFRAGEGPEALRRGLAALQAERGSRCVIAFDEGDAAEAASAVPDVDVLEAVDAKGLEFDHVVLYRPERLLPARSHADASLLLIAATRPTRTLTVVREQRA